MTRAHRAGCAYLDRMYRCPIPAKADIVLVSQGGAPKDANLYQTQKALDNAKHAVKDGGTIILIGTCPEGLGSKTFSDWLLAAPTAHSMVERISRNFQLGGHKAAAIAMVLEKASIDLISEMGDDFVRRIFLEPKPSGSTDPPPPYWPCPTAAQHCRICRMPELNRIEKQPVSKMRPAVFYSLRPRRSGPYGTTSDAQA